MRAQRTFGIVEFGEYPEGSDEGAMEELDEDRGAALVKLAERHGGKAHCILDQHGLAEWIADLVEEGAGGKLA